MEYLALISQQNQQHTVVRPDPRPYQPLTNKKQTQVPDGGVGWAFILAAVVTIGAAAIKRYLDRRASASTSCA